MLKGLLGIYSPVAFLIPILYPPGWEKSMHTTSWSGPDKCLNIKANNFPTFIFDSDARWRFLWAIFNVHFESFSREARGRHFKPDCPCRVSRHCVWWTSSNQEKTSFGELRFLLWCSSLLLFIYVDSHRVVHQQFAIVLTGDCVGASEGCFKRDVDSTTVLKYACLCWLQEFSQIFQNTPQQGLVCPLQFLSMELVL